MALEISITQKQVGAYIISPIGSIDTETCRNLEKSIEAVLDPNLKSLIMDMKGVDYISSLGLSIMFKTKDTLEKDGKLFLITNLQPQVKKVFEIVKALPTMNVFASVEEADDYLAKIQKQEIERQKNI